MWKSLQTWCCWRTNHWRHELATNENIVDLQNFKHNVSFYRWSYSCCLVHSCQTTQGSHNLISARKDWIRYEQHFFSHWIYLCQNIWAPFHFLFHQLFMECTCVIIRRESFLFLSLNQIPIYLSFYIRNISLVLLHTLHLNLFF